MVFEKCAQFFPADFCSSTPLLGKHMCIPWNRLWLKLEGPDITVHEEYVVYDFNGIVGTVGGSLGLFIGFSVLDFMLYILNRLRANSSKKR